MGRKLCYEPRSDRRRSVPRALVAIFVFLVYLMPAPAQYAVDPRNLYERIILIVPIVGTGRQADFKRPLYAPALASRASLSRDGIIGYASVPSDDGKFALVELVARDRGAFQQIYAEKRSDVKIFEKGRAKKEDIEREFRKYRKDFSLDRVEVVLP